MFFLVSLALNILGKLFQGHAPPNAVCLYVCSSEAHFSRPGDLS